MAGYAVSVLFLLMSMLVVYSHPSLHSWLRFYRLDSTIYVLFGLVGGSCSPGPLVIWFVRRRRLASFAQSIGWECSNRVLGSASLPGLVTQVRTYFSTNEPIFSPQTPASGIPSSHRGGKENTSGCGPRDTDGTRAGHLPQSAAYRTRRRLSQIHSRRSAR